MQPVNYIVFGEGHSFSNLRLHSVIVDARVASFPDRDYEFTPFYFDHHPLLIQQLQLQSTLPVIRIRLFWNPSDEDSR